MAKDISKTLVVGLGGTGQTVIRDIKKRMLRTYGEIPSLVKFLEFDTDVADNPDTPFEYYHNGVSQCDFRYHITQNEMLEIAPPGLNAIENDPICTVKLDIPALKKVASRLNGKGAGGYRVAGRSFFLNRSLDILNLLTNTVNTLRGAQLNAAEQNRGYQVVNNQITIYLIASLAGGTGSSAFLDMSRMLQIAGVNVNNQNGNPNTDQIFGMFFMPKFFETKPNTDNIRINTYTALSELDYTLDLSDPTRFPEGCQALADDEQDYRGHLRNGKRVVFSGVYLIDSLTQNGQTHTLEEASSYVASFITSSIAADGTALTSSYVNSNHKMNTVEHKYQNYSGLGFCELRFDRQNLVRYLLNQKVLKSIDAFKNDTEQSALAIAKKFIDENCLNEGMMQDADGLDTRSQQNELIDAIINLDSQGFHSVSMASVDTGKEAAEKIASNKTSYLNQIGIKVTEAVRSFETRKRTIMDNLTTLLDKHQTGKGFGSFTDLALCLMASFDSMKKGLEDEIERHETKFKSIEDDLVKIKSTIANKTGKGFLGIGSQKSEQETAINAYRRKVLYGNGKESDPTLAWLKVETARKVEAVKVFEDLIGIVKQYYDVEYTESTNGPEKKESGSFITIDRMYNSLQRELVIEKDSYRPRIGAYNETVYADAFFKEYFQTHEDETMQLNAQAVNTFDDYLGNLLTTQPAVDANLLAQIRQRLLGLLSNDDLVKKIEQTQMSFDELFIHCFGTYASIANPGDLENHPQLRLLSQVRSLFDPLWNYVNFNGQGLTPTKNMVIGVYDVNNHIFNTPNGYAQTIQGWNAPRYIGLGDPDRIVFMLMETAIPGFKLSEVNVWANEYEQKKSEVYTFSDKRMEDIDMLKPGMTEDAEIAWAYGWLFGLITNPKNKNGLRVKPSHSYLTREQGRNREANGEYNYFATTERKSDIAVYHRKFINDREIWNDILIQAESRMSNDPIGTIIKIKQWVNDEKMWDENVRGKKRESMTEKEKNIIEFEPTYLSKRFVRLGYGMTLSSDGRVTHLDSEAISSREAEMQTAAAKKEENAEDKPKKGKKTTK